MVGSSGELFLYVYSKCSDEKTTNRTDHIRMDARLAEMKTQMFEINYYFKCAVQIIRIHQFETKNLNTNLYVQQNDAFVRQLS